MLADIMTKGLARDRFKKTQKLVEHNFISARILIVIFFVIYLRGYTLQAYQVGALEK